MKYHTPLRSSLYLCAITTCSFMGAILFLACGGAPDGDNRHTQSSTTIASWPIGQWRYLNAKEKPTEVSLYSDGSALSNGGNIGSWYFFAGRVYITWMDGWTDTLIEDGTGYRKKGYAPGVATDDDASNHSDAVKISDLPAAIQ